MSELFHTLGIDWRLLGAQVLNFAVLALLLTRFLYRPMMKMLDERREKAAVIGEQSLALAEARRAFEQEMARERSIARQEADRIVQEAREKAGDARTRMLQEAEADAAAARERFRAELVRERDRVFREAQHELAGLALFAAEKVLGRETNSADTNRFVQEAVRELQGKE